LMRFLAAERSFGIPHALFVWMAVSAVIVVILRRMAFGRYIYAIGNSERAAYLAGVPTRRVIMIAFVLCSVTASLAGVML
ncbi:ABC transporter permease subunit, partial [Escherichia coli]|uniref:ABC transporter permease subunit n=1 Tax=Escherichia coli TaxID=562 RepID=UPI003CE4D009